MNQLEIGKKYYRIKLDDNNLTLETVTITGIRLFKDEIHYSLSKDGDVGFYYQEDDFFNTPEEAKQYILEQMEKW